MIKGELIISNVVSLPKTHQEQLQTPGNSMLELTNERLCERAKKKKGLKNKNKRGIASLRWQGCEGLTTPQGSKMPL